jgi:1-acyl-sn-glycerol-3-phosphate acyltransferase
MRPLSSTAATPAPLNVPFAPMEVGGRLEWLRATLVGGLLAGPLLWAILLAARSRRWALMHRAERGWARMAARGLGLDVNAEGIEHVVPGQRYVVVALHESFADVLALARLPLALRFLANDELFDWPLVGRYLRSTDQIPVRTRSGCRAIGPEALRQLRTLEAASESLAVFPQGSVLGIEVAFEAGAFRLADRLGLPVLPVVLSGGHLAWDYPFSRRLRFGQRIGMRVLPPLPAGRALEQARSLERRMKRAALDRRLPRPRRYEPERDGYWEGYGFTIDPAFPRVAAQVARYRARLHGASA